MERGFVTLRPYPPGYHSAGFVTLRPYPPGHHSAGLKTRAPDYKPALHTFSAR